MADISPKEKKKKNSLIGILLAVLAALTIRSCAVEPYHIPSSSMVPTLLVGDFLFISKYPYGFSKHSFIFSLPLIPKGRLFGHEPKRGDVVIFRQLQSDKDYIKRVIGLPGETVQMQGGRLYINDTLVPRINPTLKEITTEQGEKLTVTQYTEILPGGKEHTIYERSDFMPFDDTSPFVIPQGYYFMMGDNRDNSQDSRYFGPVSFEALEGRAEFIFFSLSDRFLKFWKWPKTLRFDRFFREIQ